MTWSVFPEALSVAGDGARCEQLVRRGLEREGFAWRPPAAHPRRRTISGRESRAVASVEDIRWSARYAGEKLGPSEAVSEIAADASDE